MKFTLLYWIFEDSNLGFSTPKMFAFWFPEQVFMSLNLWYLIIIFVLLIYQSLCSFIKFASSSILYKIKFILVVIACIGRDLPLIVVRFWIYLAIEFNIACSLKCMLPLKLFRIRKRVYISGLHLIVHKS